MSSIDKSNLTFLTKLGENNNRDWFSENKPVYQEAHQNTINFVDGLLTEMRQHDNIETLNGKKSLFRIYKDTRFSKDKTPRWVGRPPRNQT